MEELELRNSMVDTTQNIEWTREGQLAHVEEKAATRRDIQNHTPRKAGENKHCSTRTHEDNAAPPGGKE